MYCDPSYISVEDARKLDALILTIVCRTQSEKSIQENAQKSWQEKYARSFGYDEQESF